MQTISLERHCPWLFNHSLPSTERRRKSNHRQPSFLVQAAMIDDPHAGQ